MNFQRPIIVRIFLLCLSFYFSEFIYSQDSIKIRKEIEAVLKKYGFKTPIFEIKISSQNQKNGQTAFVINNYNGKVNHVVTGDNYGVNGDITVIDNVPFAEYAKFDMGGVAEHAGFGIIISDSQLSGLMKHAVSFSTETKNYTMITSDDALRYLDSVIRNFPNFPYAYFCKANLLMSRNDMTWIYPAKKAEQLFSITTKIEGHFSGQDEALVMLRKALNQK
jgi:hypothetical protein